MLKFELNHAEELERPKSDVLAKTKVLQPSSIWDLTLAPKRGEEGVGSLANETERKKKKQSQLNIDITPKRLN